MGERVALPHGLFPTNEAISSKYLFSSFGWPITPYASGRAINFAPSTDEREIALSYTPRLHFIFSARVESMHFDPETHASAVCPPSDATATGDSTSPAEEYTAVAVRTIKQTVAWTRIAYIYIVGRRGGRRVRTRQRYKKQRPKGPGLGFKLHAFSRFQPFSYKTVKGRNV